VIYELISELLSFLYFCNQQALLLRKTLILVFQLFIYFEDLFIQVKKKFECFLNMNFNMNF
jgi:hypothetical protein